MVFAYGQSVQRGTFNAALLVGGNPWTYPVRLIITRLITNLILYCTAIKQRLLFSFLFFFLYLLFIIITVFIQYLDMRFKSKMVRRLASATYYIRSILNLGVTVFTPCVALKTVMGLPYWFSIVLISSIAILFTVLVRTQ